MLVVLEALTSFVSAPDCPEGSDFLAAPQPFPSSVAMLVPAKPNGTRRDHSSSLAQQCSGVEAVQGLLVGC